jgi:hypothetical protein
LPSGASLGEAIGRRTPFTKFNGIGGVANHRMRVRVSKPGGTSGAGLRSRAMPAAASELALGQLGLRRRKFNADFRTVA